jgi:TatD DNase family protein
MVFIDTHTHLSHFKSEDRKAVLEHAKQNSVTKMINVACKLEECESFIRLAEQYENILAAVGLHPTELNNDLNGSVLQIEEYAKSSDKVVAIGEIGLDYYHDRFSHDRQEAFFVAQLQLAEKLGKPAIIHTRSGKNAGENEAVFVDLIQILEREAFSHGVMHCYSGNLTEAEKLLDLGLMFSFTGILTYERNEELREVVRMLPLDRIMLETDCPYLVPASRRGQRGEPSDVLEIAKTVAEVKDIPLEEVARMTTNNAERFFRL